MRTLIAFPTPSEGLICLKQVISIIWATGYAVDYQWLSADVFDENGKPVHQRGVTDQQGIYFLGLPWQSRRGSAFIWGVWHDAKYVADQIAKQRIYQDYHTHSLAAVSKVAE